MSQEDEVSFEPSAQISQTQPEVSNYVAEIFGSDSDDDDAPRQSSSKQVSNAELAPASADTDDIFGDSDEDDVPSRPRPSHRLQKGNQNKLVSPKIFDSTDDLVDSDEEGSKGGAGTRPVAVEKVSHKTKRRRLKVKGEERKRRRDSSSQGKNRLVEDTEKAEKSDEEAEASSDEYNSGEEVEPTADDQQFIDEDDDLADITREYDEEDQNFDDERPENYRKSKTKKGGSSRRTGGDGSGKGDGGEGGRKSVGGSSNRDDDPFSQTLKAMKKPKEMLMSEPEKDKIVESLLDKMHAACTKDEAAFRRGEPAVHKLHILPKVKQILAVKALHHNLLEKDILGALRDWIEPKRDANKTLPSLTVRTAVYELLAKLPCQTDHLKHATGDKQPIGHVILQLRKHKDETQDNKRLLREIMEKWCRPVFRKSTDARSGNIDISARAELQALTLARRRAALEEAKLAAGNGNGGAVRDAAPQLEALLEGAAGDAKSTSARQRARTPYSSGFYFTEDQRPEARTVTRKESNEKVYGQTRATLLKTLKDAKGGKKLNPRSIDMSLTGRDKL